MYAIFCIGLDITLTVWMLLDSKASWDLFITKQWRIFRYLLGTSDFVLRLLWSRSKLDRFYGADWVSDKDERKSTSCYKFLLIGRVILWCSTKQSYIYFSIHEEVTIYSLRSYNPSCSLFEEILSASTCYGRANEVIMVYCDSMTTLAYVEDPKYHGPNPTHWHTISIFSWWYCTSRVGLHFHHSNDSDLVTIAIVRILFKVILKVYDFVKFNFLEFVLY